MNSKTGILILASILVFTFPLKSQLKGSRDKKKVFYYKGRVVNQDGDPLLFAHVINVHRGYASISDSTGYFKVPVVINDTIKISTIGYHTKYIPIEKNTKDTAFHVIKLRKRAYDLPTVNIYELRWQVFKAEFMEEEVEEDKTAKRLSNWMANLVPTDELRMIFQGARGPGFALNFKTKADKSRKKVARLEKKYRLIAPKFNDEMIESLTDLKGDEIYDFLRFCNFQEDFLIHATEYEIMERVLEYWEEYKKQGLYNKKKK